MIWRILLVLSQRTTPYPVGPGFPFEEPSKFNLTNPGGGEARRKGCMGGYGGDERGDEGRYGGDGRGDSASKLRG
jgi:hypothetical protein